MQIYETHTFAIVCVTLSIKSFFYIISYPKRRLFGMLLIVVKSFFLMNVSCSFLLRGGRHQRGDGIMRLVEFGSHPLWAPDRRGESKKKSPQMSFISAAEVLWDVCRCLAFTSLTLFMVMPACVWSCACPPACVWGSGCFFFCVLAAIFYSGSRGLPGVSVWLSPPAWAPSAGSWGSPLCGDSLLALSSEHADLKGEDPRGSLGATLVF